MWWLVLLDGQGGFSSIAQVLLASSLNDLDGDGDLDALGQVVHWNSTEPNPGSGERQQYGASGPLACAARPVLGATGPFQVGVQKTLRVSGVPTGSSGLLAVGLVPAGLSDFPWPGITTLVWPWVGLVPLPPAVGAGTSAGDGLSTASFTIQPNWPNFGDLYQQAFFIDPCSPSLVTASNGLRIRYAP
jgi:hypothetical protein